MGRAVKARFSAWSHQFLISLDRVAACWLRGWWFVWVGGELPMADETISRFVGRNAIAGQAWALVAERVVDAVMGKGHCRNSARE